jgi:putative ABC transport system permease protein
MIKNYFVIAYRNLMKYKVISFINLFGLAIGLTCCLLILAYLLNELSYDRFNPQANRIYRVTRSFNDQNGVVSLNLSTISPPFGPYLLNDFPDIQKMTRLLPNGITPMRYREKLFNENNVFFADPNFFDVLSAKVLQGNPKTVLSAPFTLMLTKEVAQKYFGNEDPVGKTIRCNNQFDLKVTGIFEGLPPNAHLHPQLLVSFTTLNDNTVYGAENMRTNWGNNSFFTYLMLPENYPVNQIIAQFPAFVDKHMDHKDYAGMNPSRFTKLGLQKLTDIHLRSHTDYEAEPNGDISRIYIFSAIAFFILLIACINYMNLSTARSALRAREIGIRKVIGARRKELILQFLSESVLICCVALLIAGVCAFLGISWINKISGQNLSIGILMKWQVLVPLLVTPVVVGSLSGLYPALFLSSFQPIKTLKGLFKADGGGISFRKVLVVTQFAISIILIIATVIVFQQLHFMQKKSLGYERDRLVIMPYATDVSTKYVAFRSELLHNPSILSVARSSRIPTGRLLDAAGAFTLSGDSMRPVQTTIKYVSVDYDFFPTYKIRLLAGRNFSRNFSTDTASFILNESSVSALGWKSADAAVGKDFKYGNQTGHVIGVVNDFNFESMHQRIAPTVFLMLPASQEYFNNISIKVAGNRIPSVLSFLETTWRRFFPETPYQYNFLDERFDALYQSEQRQGTIFIVFACIAIFIACLGLFGLSAFAITQRIKEIGVRKVLGANVGRIVGLLSKDFLKLVAVAALMAFPIAWYAMNNWLKDFAYRVGINWWVFLLAAFLAAMIAWLTVGIQAMKAATANPVRSLRTE